LRVVDEVVDGDGLVAVGAGAAGSDAVAEGSAVVAALLAEVACLAVGALVDGGFPGRLPWWRECCRCGCRGGVAVPPGGLAAFAGAPAAPAGS
jgi:hypothetical protein